MQTLTLVCALTTLAGAAAVGAPTFTETFESYDASRGAQQLAPQSEWTSDFDPDMLVVSTNPIDGKSARHVPDGSHIVGFEIKSPVFTPAFGRIDMDVRMDTTFGVIYQIDTLDPETFFLNARVHFQNSLIFLSLPSNSQFQNTAQPHIDRPLGTFHLAIDVKPGGTVDLYVDGALVLSRPEASRLSLGRTGRIGQLLVWTNNQSAGASDGSGPGLTLDNVVFTPNSCPADLNGDGMVGSSDLALLLGGWGPACAPFTPCPADINGDGSVNSSDLALVLGAWGACP